MFRNYFRSVLRSLWKNKITSAINIFGLSVGMTAAVFIMIWVQNETDFDNYHPAADRIYRITTKLPSYGYVWETSPLLLADAAKKEIPEIEEATRLYYNNWPVFNINGKVSYEKKCAYVDYNWFNVFHYDFIKGNALSFSQNPYSIILTSSEAKKYFGNQDAVGKTIRVDSANYQVKAVVRDAPANSAFQYNAFIPVSALLSNPSQFENDKDWGQDNYMTFIRLSPVANAKTVTQKLNDLRQKKSQNTDVTTSLIPLKAMHFETGISGYSATSHGDRNTVYICSALALILLLIACINYVNLTTAKASLRAKEVSIRKIIGANKKQLFNQFFIESLLLSVISLVLTLMLIRLFLPTFNDITGKVFIVPLASKSLWLILGGTLVTAMLLNGIYPALLLSSFKPMNVFRGKSILKVKDAYFRKSLVVLQFVVSIILIAATIIIFEQLRYARHANVGYDKSQVFSFGIPFRLNSSEKQSWLKFIKSQLVGESSIENVATSSQQIADLGSFSAGSADWDGRDTSFRPTIAQLSADADFQKLMRLQMKEGRWFQEDVNAEKHNFIINETAVREFNLRKPVIGQHFIFHGDTGRIIGVVKDFNYKSMHEKIGPLVVWSNPDWIWIITVRTHTGQVAQAIQAVQKIWKENFPSDPIEYNFLDETFDNLYKTDQRTSILIFIASTIAVIISALGLFGLAAFTAEQRTREIGIRKLLGASVINISKLLSKDFVKLVMIAVIIATPVAWYAMNKWLLDFAYRINISWWIFLFAGGLAMLIAVVTISFQAIKAALSNPVKSLRTE